jgi:hypothetical protein
MDCRVKPGNDGMKIGLGAYRMPACAGMTAR